MEVTDADIGDIINTINTRSELSILVYGRLEGKISAKIERPSEIDDVLRYLLSDTKYTFWKDRGIYFLGPKTMQVISSVELIKLKYMKAEDAVKLLPT